MSSNLSVFDGSFLRNFSSDIFSSDGGTESTDLLCFSDPDPEADPFNLFSDTPVDVFLQDSNTQNQQYAFDVSSALLSPSPSPPSNQKETLSCHVQPPSDGPNLESVFADFSILEGIEVKNEECQMGFDHTCNQPLVPHSYSSLRNSTKHMPRSFSSNSFDAEACRLLFQPSFTSNIMDSNDTQVLSSPDNTFFTGQIRRVCSTGDLQNRKPVHVKCSSSSNPFASDVSLMEEVSFKVGRYTADERKERISKYRAKRTQRNFNKTIKYACRKTLADNRLRIRGRFARNDEISDVQKAPCSTREEDEDDLWFEGLQGEQNFGRVGGQKGCKENKPLEGWEDNSTILGTILGVPNCITMAFHDDSLEKHFESFYG